MNIYRNMTTHEFCYQVQKNQMNPFHTMHGGEITKLIDDTAGTCCHMWCSGRVSTAAFHHVRMLHPLYCDDHVRFIATIIHTGKTSLTAICYVLQDNPNEKPLLCAFALCTFVSMLNDTETQSVPPLPIKDATARKMSDLAIKVKHFSLNMEDSLLNQNAVFK